MEAGLHNLLGPGRGINHSLLSCQAPRLHTATGVGPRSPGPLESRANRPRAGSSCWCVGKSPACWNEALPIHGCLRCQGLYPSPNAPRTWDSFFQPEEGLDQGIWPLLNQSQNRESGGARGAWQPLFRDTLPRGTWTRLSLLGILSGSRHGEEGSRHCQGLWPRRGKTPPFHTPLCMPRAPSPPCCVRALSLPLSGTFWHRLC